MDNGYFRGEIYYIHSNKEYDGSVQGGDRPAIIVSNDIGNGASSIVEIVYLTTHEKKPLPTHVSISSSKYPSTALCEQIYTVNKSDIGNYMGQCSMVEMKHIDEALAVSLGIGVSIKGNALIKKWFEATAEEKPEEPIKEQPKEEKILPPPDIESQLQIAKISAERDVYKRLYEELIGSR